MTSSGAFKAFQDGFIGEEDLRDVLVEADLATADSDRLFAVLSQLVEAYDNDTYCTDVGPDYQLALDIARKALATT